MKALRFISAFIMLVVEIALMLPVVTFMVVAAGFVWVHGKLFYRGDP